MDPPLPSSQLSSDGPLAILWDMENCPVPSDVHPEDVVCNIRMALRVHPVIRGSVMMFSAYGDFNAFPRRLREGCQRTGVKLIDVPNGRKDAADKAILVDMFLFVLDNPPPSSIVLISGDVDFAPALHILGQRGCTVILVIPSGTGVSSALFSAGKFVWDWSCVARGQGFVPPSNTLMPPQRAPCEFSSYFTERCINANPNSHNEEEAILYKGNSQGIYNSRDISMVVQTVSGYNSTYSPISSFPTTSRPQNLTFGLNEVSGRSFPSRDQNECALWVHPGDLNGLKVQLVKLLEYFGGSLPLTSVPAEYLKIFGRPLYISEYGATKLVNLFKKMGDTIAVYGKGKKKSVHLRNWKSAPSAPPLILMRKDKKGKEIQEDHSNVFANNGSSDEVSDEERIRSQGKPGPEIKVQSIHDDNILEQFKYELQEILVSYACRIPLICFKEIYQQRYKKQLDYQKFGVEQLEGLLEKVRDVITVQEDLLSKTKFLSGIGG